MSPADRYKLSEEDWQTIRDRFLDGSGGKMVSAALQELARRLYGDELNDLAGTVDFYTPDELREMTASSEERPEIETAVAS